MNTAFLDAANLAWKIHHVESGLASPKILSTYESERKQVAESLLAFDNKYAALFSAKAPSAEVRAAGADKPAINAKGSETGGKEDEENEFVKTFKANCAFTSGYGVAYEPNMVNLDPVESSTYRSKLFVSPTFTDSLTTTTLKPGRILPPSTVTRVVDANVVHLEQEVPLNGAFRIYVFGGSPASTGTAYPALQSLAKSLSHPKSFLSSFPHAKPVSHHNNTTPHSPFFSILTILPLHRSSIEITDMLPPLLQRYRKHVYADDVWDQLVPNASASAHAKMGVIIDEKSKVPQDGRVVVVRPDGYVGCVIRLVDGPETGDTLDEYFERFATRKFGNSGDSRL
jgi:Phenol hydroxylase, C-terminal dimerisation domain/FAD binding domain